MLVEIPSRSEAAGVEDHRRHDHMKAALQSAIRTGLQCNGSIEVFMPCPHVEYIVVIYK